MVYLKKSSRILAVMIVATLALTGCNANNEENKEPEQKVQETTPEEKKDEKDLNKEEAKETKIKSLEDVERIVKEKHPDIKFSEIHYKDNNGKPYYEVEALEGDKIIEMKIDKTLGEVLEDKVDEVADEKDKLNTFVIKDVDKFNEAMDMIQKKVGDEAKLLGWEIKFDKDKLVYEIEGDIKGDKKEVKIDATDNTIIEMDD